MQAVQKGLADLAGPGGAEAAADSLRLVDTYIKVRTKQQPIRNLETVYPTFKFFSNKVGRSSQPKPQPYCVCRTWGHCAAKSHL